MRFSKPLVKVGCSIGIIINKPILEKLKLKEGDWIEIELKKVL